MKHNCNKKQKTVWNEIEKKNIKEIIQQSSEENVK